MTGNRRVDELKARAYDLLTECVLAVPLKGTENGENITEITFEDNGGKLDAFMRIRDRIMLRPSGSTHARPDAAREMERKGEIFGG